MARMQQSPGYLRLLCSIQAIAICWAIAGVLFMLAVKCPATLSASAMCLVGWLLVGVPLVAAGDGLGFRILRWSDYGSAVLGCCSDSRFWSEGPDRIWARSNRFLAYSQRLHDCRRGRCDLSQPATQFQQSIGVHQVDRKITRSKR
jgi:hypothetical protein